MLQRHMGISGILNVNKPCGPTSFNIVAAIRRLSGEKRVGHAGTLDPAASGILPICLGQATRLTEYIHLLSKEYIAGITLGITTDTLDAQGTVIACSDVQGITAEHVREALKPFLGAIMQVPPAYSAVKVRGRQSYKLARAGISEPLQPRRVIIDTLEILSFDLPYFKLRVQCSSGTYIRSLAHDLGTTLGCGACLQDLVRTAYGPYNLKNALTPEVIKEATMTGDLGGLLYPVDHPLLDWDKVDLNGDLSLAVDTGNDIKLEACNSGEYPLRGYNADGKFMAILKFNIESGLWHPAKVFHL